MQPPATRQPRRWRTRLKRAAVACGLLVFLWLLASYLVARRLTARPHPIRTEPVPARAWGKVEAFRLRTDDGEEIGAWFLDGRADKLPVLLLHGNGSCRSENLAEAELVASVGHPVLLLSMRAHGDSTGDRNDFGFGARRDVLAAVTWLEARCPNRPPVTWGRSLGAAAAVFAAEELGGRVRGYLLECPYQDLRTAVRNRTRQYLPPVLDFVAYAGLRTVAPAALPDFDRISPVDAIAGIPSQSRVLILAGGADRRAMPAEARTLHERCRCPAELTVIAGGDHLRLADADPRGYRAAVLGFLARCGTRAE